MSAKPRPSTRRVRPHHLGMDDAKWFADLPADVRELTKWVATGIARAHAIGHGMVHAQAELNGVANAGFFLVCTHPETAQKARALLVDALPLCTTDLGPGYATPTKVEPCVAAEHAAALTALSEALPDKAHLGLAYLAGMAAELIRGKVEPAAEPVEGRWVPKVGDVVTHITEPLDEGVVDHVAVSVRVQWPHTRTSHLSQNLHYLPPSPDGKGGK